VNAINSDLEKEYEHVAYKRIVMINPGEMWGDSVREFLVAGRNTPHQFE
jgi:hypothetical protein